MKTLLLMLVLFQPPPALPAPANELQRACEWMVAQRLAHGEITAEQAQSLAARYEELEPSQIRTLVMIYEGRYGIVAPFREQLTQGVDDLELSKEWLVAYRTVQDKWTPDQAKAFAHQLNDMSSGEIRTLVMAYEEKSKLRKEARSTSESPSADQSRLDEITARRDAENQRRQLALNQAASYRNQNQAALNSINAGANAAASRANTRYEQQQQQGVQMFERNQAQPAYNGYFGPYNGWGGYYNNYFRLY